MAELTTTDRLQPSLLDRLTDDEPRARQESRDRRVMTMRALREAVLRDLSWLLNAGSRPLSDEVWNYPLVAQSVINYGLPDLAGLTSTSVSAERLEEMVLTAIRAFEPRVVGRTLGVRSVEASERDGQAVISLEIEGDILPLPMPEALLVRTSLDLETGRCELTEGKGA